MHISYHDITSRIAMKPLWWDEHAVPRYCEFSPEEVSDIYADEVALVLIACQNCGTRFKVAFSSQFAWQTFQKMRTKEYDLLQTVEEQEEFVKRLPRWPLAENVVNLHYGDPPNNGCCAVGPTMNCDDIKVLQYWRQTSLRWVRMPEYEVMLADHPEYEI